MVEKGGLGYCPFEVLLLGRNGLPKVCECGSGNDVYNLDSVNYEGHNNVSPEAVIKAAGLKQAIIRCNDCNAGRTVTEKNLGNLQWYTPRN